MSSIQSTAEQTLLQAVRDFILENSFDSLKIEEARRVPKELSQQLASLGVFRSFVPSVYGGYEVSPQSMVDLVKLISAADSSVGWCVMIHVLSSVTAAYLPQETAQGIFEKNPLGMIGGTYAPMGRASEENGNYRVHGKWSWASGSQNCDWLLGGCIIFKNGAPSLLANGTPEQRLFFFQSKDIKIHETWNSLGLCGTGSHDFEARDLLISKDYSVSFLESPRISYPLFAFPIFGLLSVGIASVALGIARGAIDDFAQLAQKKVPFGTNKPIGMRTHSQVTLAHAEASLRSAEAFLERAIESAWTEAQKNEPILSKQMRLELRLAASQAVQACVHAVDLVYHASGGTSVFRSQSIQRRFRDIHTLTQHVLVSPMVWETSGRVLMGVETDLQTF